MSDTVPNAFLILLGQIGLFVVAFIYGLPLALILGEIQIQSIGIDEFTFIVSIAFASFMMVANIIMGWMAVRDARNKITDYPKRMFVVDLMVIFILFGMNNIIIYALGADFSAFDPGTVSTVVNNGVTAEKTSFTVFILMFLTSIYLFLCKIWNKKYYEIQSKPVPKYELELTVVISLIALFAILALIFGNIACVTLLSTIVWAFSWIYANRGWLKAESEEKIVAAGK